LVDIPHNPDLTEEQKDILFNKGTEAPFSGALLHNDKTGVYACANCGAALFMSDAKYESNLVGLAGWPSFAAAVKDDVVVLRDDTSHGMQRTEVTCANCGGHLGHIFPDDSSPSGQHYCINSVALDFQPATEKPGKA
jgi:peptide-methionine (R)-S-oxide reductase